MKKKNIEAFSLPSLMRKQILSLVKAGYYSSKSDVIKDAFRILLEENKQLKVASARYLLKKKMISKEEAVMISGMDEKEFRKIKK